MKHTSICRKSFIVMVFTVALFSGCKKSHNRTPSSVNIMNAKEDIKLQISKLGGIPQLVEVQKKFNPQYADLDGTLVTNFSSKNFAQSSVCGDDLPDYLDLVHYYRLYQCGAGYRIKFFWQISWNNKVALENPYNTSNKTKGTAKVSIPGNSNAYNETTYDVMIIDLGTDPNNSLNNIYFIEMTTSDLIPFELVSMPGATLRLGAYFASDCSTLDRYQIAPMSTDGFGFSTTLDDNPCTRNDKAWFVFPGILQDKKIGVFGYDPVGTCSYEAGAAPSLQEVQYSLDNGTNWIDFTNTSTLSTYGIYGTRFIFRWDYALSNTIPSGTYDIKIRYRNIKYDPGVIDFPLPTSSIACGTNSFDTPVWSYESFPNTVVN